MVRQYNKVRDCQRIQLLKLIYDEGYKIKKAAAIVGITYANAKVINKTYATEKRMTRIYHFNDYAKVEKAQQDQISNDATATFGGATRSTELSNS